MRVEDGLFELKELGLAESPRRDSRNRRSLKRSLPMPRGLIQKLYDACREVFSDATTGVVPSPAGVARVKSVLDEMRPDDVGLSPKMSGFRSVGNPRRPPVTYLHIYESDRFSMGIFCLPPSAVIPLHNHPGMTVFSKLLFGSMHIKSYDWVDAAVTAPVGAPPGLRLAKVNVDATFVAPCETSILYPTTGGNLHCFTAVTACAVLDVLGPPYDEVRHCTYYSAFPFSRFFGIIFSITITFIIIIIIILVICLEFRVAADDAAAGSAEEGLEWLEETEKPEEFSVVGAKYTGPRMVLR